MPRQSALNLDVIPGGTTTYTFGDVFPGSTVTVHYNPFISIISANVTLSDNSVYFVSTSAARTLTLPNPATTIFGIWIKDFTFKASSNNITVAQFSSELIEQSTGNLVLQANGGSWFLFSNSSNWYLL